MTLDCLVKLKESVTWMTKPYSNVNWIDLVYRCIHIAWLAINTALIPHALYLCQCWCCQRQMEVNITWYHCMFKWLIELSEQNDTWYKVETRGASRASLATDKTNVKRTIICFQTFIQSLPRCKQSLIGGWIKESESFS